MKTFGPHNRLLRVYEQKYETKNEMPTLIVMFSWGHNLDPVKTNLCNCVGQQITFSQNAKEAL